jgi:predicted transcriptional regulator
MTIEVLPAIRERSLEELAQAANEAHAEVMMHLHSAIHAAIRAGEAIHDAHLRLGLDGFGPWCEQNLDCRPSTAGGYERLAVYRDHLPPEIFQPFVGRDGRTRQASVGRALLYIKTMALPPLHDSLRPRYRAIPEDTKREMRRLAKIGVGVPQISDMLGVSRPTIYKYLNPDANKRYRERARQQNRERAQARRALRDQRIREEKERRAKGVGGNMGEAYSLVRRALQEVERSYRQAASAEIREYLRTATTHLHRAEDEISKALKGQAR